MLRERLQTPLDTTNLSGKPPALGQDGCRDEQGDGCRDGCDLALSHSQKIFDFAFIGRGERVPAGAELVLAPWVHGHKAILYFSLTGPIPLPALITPNIRGGSNSYRCPSIVDPCSSPSARKKGLGIKVAFSCCHRDFPAQHRNPKSCQKWKNLRF